MRERAAREVNALVKVELDQHEFDALVDFAYNLGAGDLAKSTLLRRVNERAFAAAADEFAGCFRLLILKSALRAGGRSNFCLCCRKASKAAI